MRRSLRATVTTAAFMLAAPVAFMPSASAATSTLNGCSVQVNNPHSSTHAPGRINTEFRVFTCARTSTLRMDKYKSVISGNSGGGDLAYKCVGTVTVAPGQSASRFYNAPCTVGRSCTVTMKGKFTMNGFPYSRVAQESNTFVCR